MAHLWLETTSDGVLWLLFFTIADLRMEIYYYHSTYGYDRTLDPYWVTNDHGRHDLPRTMGPGMISRDTVPALKFISNTVGLLCLVCVACC